MKGKGVKVCEHGKLIGTLAAICCKWVADLQCAWAGSSTIIAVTDFVSKRLHY